MSFIVEVEKFLEQHPDLESVELLLTDINGLYRGKRIPASGLRKVAENGAYFPITTPFLMVQGANAETLNKEYGSDPDRSCRPVEGSLQLMPWAERKSAQLLLQMQDEEGAPFFFDPRDVLQRVMQRFEDAELKPVVALEYEFYLLEAGSIPPKPVAPQNGMPESNSANCYNLEISYDFDVILADIEAACQEQGLNVIGVVCEYGSGQFEVNLAHSDDIMAIADHALMLKRIIRGVARKHGLLASFMAKPFTDDVGSGLHAHVSVLDRGDRNIFSGDAGEKRLEAAVGGLIASMPEATAIFAPNANSYRRFDPTLFAPITPNWGENNRKTSIRLPLADDPNRRFEHRVSGADASPHLVLASILSGCHYGMTESCDPGTRLGEFEVVGASDPLPNRWNKALDRMEEGFILREYLGDDFIDLFLAVKRDEEEARNREVPLSDYEQYLRLL